MDTLRKSVPSLTDPSVAVPGRENALPVAVFVPEKETVPEGGIAPLVPTLAVNAYVPYVFVPTGPEIQTTVYVVCRPGKRGPTVNSMPADALAAASKVPRNTAL
jgi:hypothetical protein